MTCKQRVIDVINHKEADKIPYTVDLLTDSREKLKDYYNDPDFESKLENPFAYTGASGFPKEREVEPGIYQDNFGVHWDRRIDKDCGIIHEAIVNEDNFDDFEFPNPNDEKLYHHLIKTINDHPDKFIIAGGPSIFERSWFLCGLENVLMDMAVNEKFLFKMYDKIMDYNLQLIDNYLKFDIDCVHINDDYGQQTGLIMGGKYWRKFFKPGLKLMVDKIKSGNKYVRLHSCGNITEIIPDLIEIGIDIINPLQPEVMDVFWLKDTYGKDITFHGGISEQRTLNTGTPDDVEKEMREKMKRLGRGGGYILGPSQGITSNVPVENVVRFIDVAKSQGL